jgi:hypothetical protein
MKSELDGELAFQTREIQDPHLVERLAGQVSYSLDDAPYAIVRNLEAKRPHPWREGDIMSCPLTIGFNDGVDLVSKIIDRSLRRLTARHLSGRPGSNHDSIFGHYGAQFPTARFFRSGAVKEQAGSVQIAAWPNLHLGGVKGLIEQPLHAIGRKAPIIAVLPIIQAYRGNSRDCY